MNIGLGIGLPFSLRNGFSITSLFALGEQGAWYDPSDWSTLFQDSAGTLPVTAVGQPVGKMLDKSGRGNHASQPTAINRPVLQIDGNGKHYLAFNGTNSWMSTASIDFTATDKMTVVAGVRKLADTTGIIAELSVNGGAGSAFYVVAGSDVGDIGYTSLGSGSMGGTGAIAKSFTYAGLDTAVLAITHDISGDLSTIRRNAVAGIRGIADKGLGNFGNHQLYIGARAGSTLFFNGNLYSMVIRGALSSDAQIVSAEKFANSKTGAY